MSVYLRKSIDIIGVRDVHLLCDLKKAINTMGTLIQLATISTLAACLQLNIVSSAVATGRAGSSIGNSSSSSIGNPAAARSTPTASDTLLFANNAYEPEPNGKPKSDGMGTR